MEKERYNAIMWDETEELTQEDLDNGWHYCFEWDGLLIHTSWDEFECCSCLNEEKEDGTDRERN